MYQVTVTLIVIKLETDFNLLSSNAITSISAKTSFLKCAQLGSHPVAAYTSISLLFLQWRISLLLRVRFATAVCCTYYT